MMNSFFSAVLLLAQSPPPENPGAPPEEPSSFTAPFIISMLIIFVAFYFLIGRPQKKAQEEKAKVAEGMKKGDKVLSAGGIHGSVARVNKNKGTVHVQVAKGVEIEFNQGSLNPAPEEKKKDDEKKEEGQGGKKK